MWYGADLTVGRRHFVVARRIERFPRNAEAQALELIDLIYAAATDEAQWPVVLESLVKTTASDVAYISLYDAAAQREVVARGFGGDESLKAEYEREWAKQNVYMLANAATLETGSLVVGEAAVPDAEVKRTAFYNDFLTRMGVMHHSGMCLFVERSARAFLIVDQRIGRASHSPEEIAFFRLLMPHLQRAIAVQHRLQQIELERSAAEAALDRLPVGVIMLRQDGRVRSCNAAAKQLLDQNDGLVVRRDGLLAIHDSKAAALRRLIASACGVTGLQPSGGWLQVPRPSGRRAFMVLVAPLRLERSLLVPNASRAIVFITDPEQTPESLEDALARVYDLTPAESRVTVHLLAGASVTELADQLAITTGTARWTLKRIFEKVGVRSQAELMRVLIRGVAGLQTEHLNHVRTRRGSSAPKWQ